MKNLSKWTMALSLSLVFLLTACGAGNNAEGQAELAGSSWQLQSIDGSSDLAATPTIQFSESDAAGSGGCNSYSGSYEANASAGSISISQVVSTLMACEEPINALEAEFFGALQSATRYEINGGTLTIFGEHTLVFQQS
jgi:heat shock protein HslJ